MTIEDARCYWSRRLKSAESYSDEHWDAEERHTHQDYVDAMSLAIEALSKHTPNTQTVLTNGDKIRQMTDEELARFLEITCGCSICFLDATAGECAGFKSSMDCIVNKMKWLKQEVSGSALPGSAI